MTLELNLIHSYFKIRKLAIAFLDRKDIAKEYVKGGLEPL